MDISIQRVDRVLKRIKSITIEVEAKLDQEMAEAKRNVNVLVCMVGIVPSQI